LYEHGGYFGPYGVVVTIAAAIYHGRDWKEASTEGVVLREPAEVTAYVCWKFLEYFCERAPESEGGKQPWFKPAMAVERPSGGRRAGRPLRPNWWTAFRVLTIEMLRFVAGLPVETAVSEFNRMTNSSRLLPGGRGRGVAGAGPVAEGQRVAWRPGAEGKGPRDSLRGP